MYDIPGATLEAPTLGRRPSEGRGGRKTITIGRDELRLVYQMLNYGTSDDNIDFVDPNPFPVRHHR